MKIVTWNTQWFKGLDEVVSVERVLRVARELADYDVICMQEVAVNYPALSGLTDMDQPEKVQQLLPGFQIYFSAAIDELSPCGSYRQKFGNLIATRLAVKSIEHVPLPYPNPVISDPTPSMQRICQVMTVQAPWGPVRIMTTHLEYYSQVMRHAQAVACRDLHLQGCALADFPSVTEEGTPYQPKPLTTDTVLCGDFNFEQGSVEHADMIRPHPVHSLHNAWNVLNGGAAHPATFRIYDRKYGPEPVGCDFFFVSESLKHRVNRFAVDQGTKVSDHQPVMLELGE